MSVRCPKAVVRDEYGNRAYLSLSGDGHRVHLHVEDDAGRETWIHAAVPGLPPDHPHAVPFAHGWGAGFWSPASAIRLARVLLQYALGSRAAADAAIRAGRAAAKRDAA